ncbi:MAG: hypothetical protein JSR90_14210 [Proteobacteria bacterium]|nr:hypothetical protein [Pseudomonadota bacterium]
MRRQVFLGILLAFAVVSVAARAQPVRIPGKGDPALVVEVPRHWELHQEEGHVALHLKGAKVFLQLSMVSGLAVDRTPLPTIASNVFEAAGMPAWSQTLPATIDGRAGQAYVSVRADPGGGIVTMVLTLVKLDPLHVAALIRGTVDSEASAQAGYLDELAGSIRIVGAR